jgi:hypothetical protein
MKLSAVITEVRRVLQDNTAPYRYSDTYLLGFANQALKRMAVLRPDLFAYIGVIPCTAGVAIQSAPADSIRIMEIFQVEGGSGVTEVSRDSLDETYPGWMNDPAGPCVNWMRHVRNPNRFFIYPKAPVGQTLLAEYSQTPPDYAADADVALLPDAYFPVVVDGTIFLAESVDNEHVNAQSRTLTDTEEAGLDPKQVI